MPEAATTMRDAYLARAVVLLLIIGLVAALLPALTASAPADAAAADTVRERGVVTHVADGDTIDVLVDGDRTTTRIRLSGIQAFEIGECGYDIATDRLRELILGERVKLRAKDPNASSMGRPIRSVHLDVQGYGEVDVVELMLLEGMGLWFPMEPEITDTADYNVAATHATRQQRGIWQDHLCGRGPQFGHPIDMWVRSDADGNDAHNLNDEYVRIVNRHATQAFDLTGWLIRESSQFPQDVRGVEGYHFPAGTTIPPGKMLTVRVGSGRDRPDELFMGSDSPLFDNSYRSLNSDTHGRVDLGMGDGVYLLDPLGNVRESYTWPCVVDCSTDLHGKLVIDHVEYDPPGVDTADTEYVELKNVSNRRIHLDGYQLRNIFVFHEFAFGTYMDPGEVLKVTVGKGTNTRLNQYWGQDGPILRNSGDRVDVVSYDERFVHCVDWGEGRDCPWPVDVPGVGTTGRLPTHPRLVSSEVFIAGPFGDVPVDHSFATEIGWAVDRGITTGFPNGDFRPRMAVSRQAAAAFLYRLAGEPEVTSKAGFSDVPASHPFHDAIAWLVAEGITGGFANGEFRPTRPVSRQAAAAFLYRFDGEPGAAGAAGFPDVAADHPFETEIAWLVGEEITGGFANGEFRPLVDVTRQAMAAFLSRYEVE